MIYEFEISTTPQCYYLSNHIADQFNWLRGRGYELDIERFRDEVNDLEFFNISINKGENDHLFSDTDIIYIFKHQLAELLAGHILEDWEEKLIIKEIQRRGSKINYADRANIIKKTRSFMMYNTTNENLNSLLNFGRKNKLAYKIMDYIYNHHRLVVEGFINFCLREYLNEIRFAVDFACEELKHEQEYSEFVKLLRYFVDSQPPRVKQVNLVMDKGLFYLWDDKGVKIDDRYIRRYLSDISLNDINLDDMLISILVTIAPLKIMIHEASPNGNNNEAVEIIKKVFADRISICKGCKECQAFFNRDGQKHQF